MCVCENDFKNNKAVFPLVLYRYVGPCQTLCIQYNEKRLPKEPLVKIS